MLGLLDKARKLRDTLGLGPDGREEFAFDPDSGITREEQTEIRQEIEKVAGRSRMAVSPEMFIVKAAKRGVLFPVLVNIAAVVTLAAGLAVLYFLFQRGETQASHEDTTNITAEGKLLAQVKKESEARLQEKNAQINQIEGRLAEIDKQRQDLQSTMDAKIQARESELKASMAADLDAEKARLQKQGLSDQAIQRRLADLEAQQNTQYTVQLASYRSQAEADRQKSEAALQDLRNQYNTDLAKANADRAQAVSDSRKREADLQAQLQQQTQALQSANAQTQQQLTALTSEKQQEDLVSQQLVGLYSVAQSDIAAKNYTKALTSLQAISSYVNSADVATLPGIAKRRPVDLFIVDSLSSLVQGEIDKSSTNTASLVETANMIRDVRSAVAAADNQLQQGNVAEAETQYTQALSVIPEIQKSYAYFTTRTRDAETARQNALRAGLARAETAFAAGRYPESLAAYRDALAYLPETPARIAAAVSTIGNATTALGEQRSQADQSQAAAPALAQGDSLLSQHQYADAITQYLAVLQNYPRSAQALPAVKGITDGVAGLSGDATVSLKGQADQVTLLKGQLASVQTQLGARLQEITAFKKGAMNLLGQAGDPASADSAELLKGLQARFGDLSAATSSSTDLQKSLDAAVKRSSDLSDQVSRLSAENARLASDLGATRQDADRQRLLASQAQDALRAAQAAGGAGAQNASVSTPLAPIAGVSEADARAYTEFQALVASYLAYTRQEDTALGQFGQRKALMLSIGARDSVLASMGRFFNGILGRVKRYELQSSADGIDTGRKAALDDVISLMTGVANQASVDAQKSFLEARLAAEKDPRMKNVIGALAKFLTNR
jgi:tetratricopeptide (TPR) repeat protein